MIRKVKGGNNRIGVVDYERKRIGCNSHTGNITMSRKDYFYDNGCY